MSFILFLGLHFYIALFLWFVTFFWFRYKAYPIHLKKMLLSGKVWVYLPLKWRKNPKYQTQVKLFSLLLILLTGYFSSMALNHFVVLSNLDFVLFFVLFVLLVSISARYWIRYVAFLELDYYYLQYHKQYEVAQKEGRQTDDADIRNKCAWYFQSNLSQADEKGRFLAYLLNFNKTQRSNKAKRNKNDR